MKRADVETNVLSKWRKTRRRKRSEDRWRRKRSNAVVGGFGCGSAAAVVGPVGVVSVAVVVGRRR